MKLQVTFVALALLFWTGMVRVGAAEEPLDYNRDIRPILSDKCFACHGPDAGVRQGGFRFDQMASALGEADSGARPIVPGDPAASALVERIETTDADLRMPPAESGKALSDDERALLRRWIAEGAEYQKLWSFVAPERPSLPAVTNQAWPRNGVDHFILAQLEARGLRPAPEADRATLLRRLTLDLTGLPPHPDDVDAFLEDSAPDAYEKVVDRLLNSQHFGERMAVEWLDAARFADTHGYHIDSGRDMTLWREYVIRSFNENKPFDEFTIEQLAGDLLPEATLEQRIASGFHRNHMINFEGGAIPEEYHNAYIVDRVNTTGAVWLGLTVACAQCHDHKYDPITQKEFYQLYAFFYNVPEKGLDGSQGNAAPLLRVPTDEQREQLVQLDAAIAQLDSRMRDPNPEFDAAQQEWEASLTGSVGEVWQVFDPTEFRSTGGAMLTRLEDGSVLAGGPNPAVDVHEFVAETTLASIHAVRLEALTHESLPGGGPGRFDNSNFVLSHVELTAEPLADPAARTAVKLERAFADYSQKNYDIAAAIDGDPATGWAVDGPTKKEARQAVFVPAEPFGFEGGTRLRISLHYESPHAAHVIGRTRLAAGAGPRAAVNLPANIEAILALEPAARSAEQSAELRHYYREQHVPEFGRMTEQLATLRAERAEIDKQIPTTMVMQEMADARETFIRERGQYDKLGERVYPDVPASLPPLPADRSADRLALAQWLVAPNHPLTARVTVNRYWQMLFGTGLVKTSEDFGSQGELSSHPELLDWLAVEFRAPSAAPLGSGSAQAWDVKAMIRLLVTSAAYRQSSLMTRESLEADPENRLLSRGPRFRLQAEFIRDLALSVSGLLDTRIGGRSVSPYQPAGLWDELASREDGKNWTAQTYVQSHGRDLYRRTMYTFWKRTSPPPTLVTFDAPDRETCTVRRARTNTPLQALILMNDPTYVEAARKFAERIMREGGATEEQRVAFAFRWALGRPPRDHERAIALDLLARQQTVYEADPAAAAELLATGEAPRDEQLRVEELAAWTIVASAILNLDETITKG